MLHFGIDLGGTNVAAGVVADDGTILGKASLPTPRGASLDGLADAIAAACEAALGTAGVPREAVGDAGVGTPGAVEPSRGLVTYCCTFDLYNAPLAAAVSQRLGLPVALENDANAAACGEMVCGAGTAVRNLVAVTYGTGVGGGVIVDGKLLTGVNHAAGELGHIVIERNGLPCSCGRRGCYEQYASATALIRRTREAMAQNPSSLLWQFAPTEEEVTGRTAFDAAGAGCALAKAVVDGYLEDVACGLVNLVQIFQPELVVLGGGISGQGEALLQPLQAVLDREDYARFHQVRTKLAIAELGNDAGIIGAALVRRFQKE
jgi:glucokinase